MADSTTSLGVTTPIVPKQEEWPSFYVEEPDIPEGMTCATWRRRRRPRSKARLFARVRVRQLTSLCLRSLAL